VRQAAVVPGPDARFGEIPVAFVVLHDSGQASVGELATHLQTAGLARQKTPAAWYFVDSLPMTPSGKVKRFELAATAVAASGSR
jgi:acyl-coenzyme A synthetase/AMP-(fatty) acid ligase